LASRSLVIDRGPAGQSDELLRGDDPLDQAVRAMKLDLLEQREDLGRMLHPALLEAL
jgi:hypothetical protein